MLLHGNCAARTTELLGDTLPIHGTRGVVALQRGDKLVQERLFDRVPAGPP